MSIATPSRATNSAGSTQSFAGLPAVLTDTTPDMKVVREEIFGPSP
jgi:acyl-CoA reductase-like NAD-dependent aldehyde dehydrogenase